MPVTRSAAAAAALLVLLSACSGSNDKGQSDQTSIPLQPGPPPPLAAAEIPQVVTGGPTNVDYGRLDARLNQLMSDPSMVGMAVAVIENGEIRYARGFGVTTRDGQPVTETTVFRWASLSKGVAADMVATLAARGQLSLDDPISRWSSTLRLPGGAEARLTVTDLLAQRLGIPKHAFERDLETGGDPRLLRQRIAELGAACTPGTCHSYQNVAYDASSEIVERVVGEPYPKVLYDYFFAPLGMTTASVTREGLLQSAVWARPHRGGRGSAPLEVSDAYYRVPAAGGVNGSILDLAIWARAQMGLMPAVLPPDALAQVQTPRVDTPGENRRRARYSERVSHTQYGLGWRIIDYAGRKVVGHHGGVLGYRSLILLDPEIKSGVVVLWNSGSARPNGIEYEVMDAIYRLPFHDWLELDRPRGAAEESEPN